MGRANRPTPPNRTKNIHPKKDKIAMMYTAREVSSFMILSLVEGEGMLSVPSWLSCRTTSVTGSSTNFRNAQLMNKIITEMTRAPNV